MTRQNQKKKIKPNKQASSFSTTAVLPSSAAVSTTTQDSSAVSSTAPIYSLNPYIIGFPSPIPSQTDVKRSLSKQLAKESDFVFRLVQLTFKDHGAHFRTMVTFMRGKSPTIQVDAPRSPEWPGIVSEIYEMFSLTSELHWALELWDMDVVTEYHSSSLTANDAIIESCDQLLNAITSVIPEKFYKSIRVARRGFYKDHSRNPITMAISGPEVALLEPYRPAVLSILEQYGHQDVEIDISLGGFWW